MSHARQRFQDQLPTDPLSRPVSDLTRAAEARATQLARLGIHTIGDLLMLRPRRYEDRRQVQTISSLGPGDIATVRGRVLASGLKRLGKGRKTLFELILEDDTGRVHCRWWNRPYMKGQFHQGTEIIAHGRVHTSKPPAMEHPETEAIDERDEPPVHLNRIVPVYPLTEGITQRWLRSLLFEVLQQYRGHLCDPWPISLGREFPSREEAVVRLHFPDHPNQPQPARQRLALDELIQLQLSIQTRRKRLLENAPLKICQGDNRLIKPFLANLGFRCTDAQTRVLREIRADLLSGVPMRRLLQGDVGSGKTVVSACAALMAIESGFQAALMAPTEILAEQHFQLFERWFAPLGIDVHLHTANRKPTLDPTQPTLAFTPESPSPGSLAVGTHALIEGAFSPDNLGLVIIDEQHRFGVAQREKLVRKGNYPHLLVMTATPIPRTLGLTLYGDLDVSIIDQHPGGRIPVKTHVRTQSSLPKVWDFVHKQLDAGRQAYVVYPRIETDGNAGPKGLKAVTREFDSLRERFLPHATGLLHGSMPREEKESVMRAFREGHLQLLLATTVIEVGVDVPNATIMVIENAEQYGLAQLHQLRGRIGRGTHESHCILLTSGKSDEANRRLTVLAKTTDGFEIAEADLLLRGPGDLLGSDQRGLPKLLFADLTKDVRLVERARHFAADLLKTDEWI